MCMIMLYHHFLFLKVLYQENRNSVTHRGNKVPSFDSINTEHKGILIYPFKHGKWKKYSGSTRPTSCNVNWGLRYRWGKIIQQTWRSNRNCCPKMLQMLVVVERTKTSNHMWTSLLQAMHRTINKWRVSFCVCSHCVVGFACGTSFTYKG